MRHLVACLAFVLVLLPAAWTVAQEAAPPATDRAALEQLIQNLEDPARREQLLSDLRTLLDAQQSAVGQPTTAKEGRRSAARSPPW
jgi:hypothetical protein